MKRHSFLCAAALIACVALEAQDKSPVAEVRIRIDPHTVVSHVSGDFIGFGYETSATAQEGYFNATNTSLVNLYRTLSTHGLVRIGGNISDHTKYVPEGVATVSPEKGTTVINRATLQDFAKFLRATGWKAMWGLNLGTGSKEDAAQEAVAVKNALGDRLQSFQIGNEVDLLPRFKSWTNYFSAFQEYQAAIRTTVPGAPFSGPDVANRLPWLETFADAESCDLRLLTHHYYRGGAKNPEATIETLLSPDDAWLAKLRQLKQISDSNGVPFRVNEVNSFYGGGKPGVSDTFASALWCLDFMFTLASYGCDGVNMETDINQFVWISHYSPIVHDAAGHCGARPEYYGMLAFAVAGNGNLLKLDLNKDPSLNLTACATKDRNRAIWLTIINKDLATDAAATIALPESCATAEAIRLTAPSIESTNHITLAGAEVSADGKWSPANSEKLEIKNRLVRLQLRHASAVLLHCQ